jgi:hypothetical protein
VKKLLIAVVIIILAIGAYVVFTLNSGEELNEPSPLDLTPDTASEDEDHMEVKDALDSMSEETQSEFMEQVESMREEVMEKAETMPQEAKLLAQGEFAPRFHSVEGQALLIEADGETILRFEDFDTDNGPRLHIYLSTDLGDDDFVDLGPIKATKGNVNYTVPPGTDLDRYRHVLVWCKPFSVLFSYADLVSE